MFTEFTQTIFIEEINPLEFYGSKVDEIVNLENKLLFEFTTFYLMNKPIIWPGMAFNLDAPGNLNNNLFRYYIHKLLYLYLYTNVV